MIPRTLEPEVMESADEARDYDAMDHSAVNDAFVADFLSALDAFGVEAAASDQRVMVLDTGTGTALIPIALAQRHDSCVITAVDLSEEMLRIARRNIEDARLNGRIDVSIGDCKALRFADGSFDAVMSNSIIHHLPEPVGPLVEMARVVRRGGLLFLRDLLRPDSIRDVTGWLTCTPPTNPPMRGSCSGIRCTPP